MAALRTTLVRKRHAWTADDVLWQMDSDKAPSGLFNLLASGGLSNFGGSNSRFRIARRQTRFLWVAAGLAAVWLVFLFV